MTNQKDDPMIETTTTIIGDWRIVKHPNSDGSVTKFMNQRCINDEDKEEIFQIGFQFNQENKQTTVEIFVPLGVLLTQTIKFGIDQENLYEATYQSCFPEGCLATANINDAIEKLFEKHDAGILQFSHIEAGNVSLSFSLNGFSEGYKELKS